MLFLIGMDLSFHVKEIGSLTMHPTEACNICTGPVLSNSFGWLENAAPREKIIVPKVSRVTSTKNPDVSRQISNIRCI